MIESETIGDILGAALSCIEFDPPAPDPDWLAQVEAARELSRRVALMTGVTESEAFDALTYIPDNLLPLLHSPQGWSTLAGMMANDLGVIAPTFKPMVH